jgi:hypothetical protein
VKIPSSVDRRVTITFSLYNCELEEVARLPDFEAACRNGDDAGIEAVNEFIAKLVSKLFQPGEEAIWEQFHEAICRIWKTLPHPTVLDDIVEATSC